MLNRPFGGRRHARHHVRVVEKTQVQRQGRNPKLSYATDTAPLARLGHLEHILRIPKPALGHKVLMLIPAIIRPNNLLSTDLAYTHAA